GKYVIGGVRGFAKSHVRVWDGATGKLLHSYRGDGLVQLARGGALLLRTGDFHNRTLAAYDFDSQKLQTVIPSGVRSFCLSADEKYVFATDEKTLRKAELDTGKLLGTWRLPRGVELDGGHAVYCASAD